MRANVAKKRSFSKYSLYYIIDCKYFQRQDPRIRTPVVPGLEWRNYVYRKFNKITFFLNKVQSQIT